MLFFFLEIKIFIELKIVRSYTKTKLLYTREIFLSIATNLNSLYLKLIVNDGF